MTIDDLRKSNLIIYEYIRGSHAYKLNIEGQSDIDVGGVFICPPDALYGLRSKYVEQVSDLRYVTDRNYYNEQGELISRQYMHTSEYKPLIKDDPEPEPEPVEEAAAEEVPAESAEYSEEEAVPDPGEEG